MGALIERCCHFDSARRPDFSQIQSLLKQVESKNSNDWKNGKTKKSAENRTTWIPLLQTQHNGDGMVRKVPFSRMGTCNCSITLAIHIHTFILAFAKQNCRANPTTGDMTSGLAAVVEASRVRPAWNKNHFSYRQTYIYRIRAM